MFKTADIAEISPELFGRPASGFAIGGHSFSPEIWGAHLKLCREVDAESYDVMSLSGVICLHLKILKPSTIPLSVLIIEIQ